MDEMLEKLCYDLMLAKKHENVIKSERIRLEEEIADLIPSPDNGQKTITLSNGVKVTVSRGYNYKANIPEIQKVFLDDMIADPAPLKAKTTVELDEKGYEWYRVNRPGIFSEVSKHVVVTPKKVSVVVKEN